MQGRPIQVDERLQELTPHGTTGFPVSMDEQHVSSADCRDIPHWHYEIQIVRMLRGCAEFVTPMGRVRLKPGEGVFLNSGVLHEIRQDGTEDGVYVCVNFAPTFLAEDQKSTIYRDYIAPLVASDALQVLPLRDEPWHREILDTLLELARVDEEQNYGYEIEMKQLLCRIWRVLVLNNRHCTERASVVSFADKQRARVMINFIQENYRSRIMLADIAGAGHVSNGECCRVFQRMGLPSPIEYLRRTRIAQSAKLLCCTALDIMEVAFESGFESSSYYAKCFKKEMSCTPVEYRQAHRKSCAVPKAYDVSDTGGEL